MYRNRDETGFCPRLIETGTRGESERNRKILAGRERKKEKER